MVNCSDLFLHCTVHICSAPCYSALYTSALLYVFLSCAHLCCFSVLYAYICTALCYTILYISVLHFVTLYCTNLHCPMLFCTVHICTALCYSVLYTVHICTVLCYSALPIARLYCAHLYSPILFCTVHINFCLRVWVAKHDFSSHKNICACKKSAPFDPI